MQSSAPGRKQLAGLVTLLLAAVPIIFTACGGGTVAPATDGSSQKNAPIISSVVPDTADPAGGTAVIINGSNFTAGTQASPTVSFGGVLATQVTVVSPIQLSTVVPAHAAGTVSVNVTTADGQSSTLTGGFTYTTASLSIKGTSPISGPAAGGTTVTISGADFQSGASVTFGGFAATSVTFTNSTTLVAVTPPHASGPASVAITNPNGQSATLASGFTFHSIDLLWSAPSTSPITITGYNIYRASSTAGPFGKLNGATPLVATSFEDPTVEGSTTYYYEVTSVGSNGTESSPDGPVPATTSP